jgi:multiple sugar transport system ATP-binding protein
MTMATHVGVLDQGRLVQFGTPREIYEDPVSTYVATRLGQPRINLLPADAFGPGAPAGAAQMGLRPEHIGQGKGQPATVRRLEHLGDQTRLHLTLGPHEPCDAGRSAYPPVARRNRSDPSANPTVVRRLRQPHLQG